MTDMTSDVHYNAARIALLAIRAGLAQASQAVPRAFLCPPLQEPVDREAAVSLLARLPKPIICEPTIRRDAVSIGARPLTAEELSRHDEHLRYWRSQGGFLTGSEQTHLSALDGVYCVGENEAFFCRVGDYEAFFEGYESNLAGMTGSPPSWFLPIAGDAARQAHRLGAKLLLRFVQRRDDWAAERAGRVIVLHHPGPGRWDYPEVLEQKPDELAPCDGCSSSRAVWRATDTRVPTWPEEQLCASCAAQWLAGRELAFAAADRQTLATASPARAEQLGDHAGQLLRELRARWKLLPMPSDVAEIAAWYETLARRGAA